MSISKGRASIPKTFLERKWQAQPKRQAKLIKHRPGLWEYLYPDGFRLLFNPKQKVSVSITK